jgi:anti-anti-sigma regulatory factor
MPQDPAACVQLALDGALTMRTAEAVRATLRAAIEPAGANIPPGDVIIDCSAADEIDLTFIQMLVALEVSAGLQGLTVGLAAKPDGVLLDTLTRGGFRVVPASETGRFWFAGEAA